MEYIWQGIERVGMPCVALAFTCWIILKLFNLRELERKNKDDRLTLAIDNLSGVVASNSAVTKDLSSDMKKQIGSDPDGKMCRFNALQSQLSENNILIAADAAEMILRRREEVAAQKILDTAAAVAAAAKADDDSKAETEARHNRRNVEQAAIFKAELEELKKKKSSSP